MSQKINRRSRWVMSGLVLTALIAASTALAFVQPKLVVHGPGTVAFGSTYKVTVSGTTGSTPANAVTAFEGGYANGKPLHCYQSDRSERIYFPKLALAPVSVHGSFTHTFTFKATHSGSKALCAYLVHEPIPATNHPYPSWAPASAIWTVS